MAKVDRFDVKCNLEKGHPFVFDCALGWRLRVHGHQIDRKPLQVSRNLMKERI